MINVLFSSSERESILLWLPLHTKSIIYAAGRRLLKCVLPLIYLGFFWWCRRGFKPFILILSYSSVILFKTGIYRPSRTAKKPLIGKVESDFSVKMLWKSRDFPQIYRKCLEKQCFLDLFCFDCALKTRSSLLRFMLSHWWKWSLFLTNGICMASQYCSRHEYYSGKLCICE